MSMRRTRRTLPDDGEANRPLGVLWGAAGGSLSNAGGSFTSEPLHLGAFITAIA